MFLLVSLVTVLGERDLALRSCLVWHPARDYTDGGHWRMLASSCSSQVAQEAPTPAMHATIQGQSSHL